MLASSLALLASLSPQNSRVSQTCPLVVSPSDVALLEALTTAGAVTFSFSCEA